MTDDGKKPTIEEMHRLQRQLQDQIANAPGVLGVGIGLNASRTSYAFKVLVEGDTDTDGLPSTIEEVEVMYEVAGQPKLLESEEKG